MLSTHELVGKLHGIDFKSLEMSPGVENNFRAPTLNSLGSMDVFLPVKSLLPVVTTQRGFGS